MISRSANCIPKRAPHALYLSTKMQMSSYTKDHYVSSIDWLAVTHSTAKGTSLTSSKIVGHRFNEPTTFRHYCGENLFDTVRQQVEQDKNTLPYNPSTPCDEYHHRLRGASIVWSVQIQSVYKTQNSTNGKVQKLWHLHVMTALEKLERRCAA